MASRSVSSVKANLFFAADTPDIYMRFADYNTEAVTAAAEVGKELADAHTSKVFDQWLARHTKSNLQLRHGTETVCSG